MLNEVRRDGVVIPQAYSPTDTGSLFFSGSVHREHRENDGIARLNGNGNKLIFFELGFIHDIAERIRPRFKETTPMAAGQHFERAKLLRNFDKRQPNHKRVETPLYATPILVRRCTMISARDLESVRNNMDDRSDSDDWPFDIKRFY